MSDILTKKNNFLEKCLQMIVALILTMLLQALSFYGNRVFFNSDLAKPDLIRSQINELNMQKTAIQNHLNQKNYQSPEQKNQMVHTVNEYNKQINHMNKEITLADENWITKAYISNIIYAFVCMITAFFLTYPVLRYSLYVSALLSYSTSMVYGLSFLGNLGMFLTVLISLAVFFVAVI